MHLFIDSSVLPKKKSVGCYLLLDNNNNLCVDSVEFTTEIRNKIVTVNLQSVSSTDAELELATLALQKLGSQVTHVYTDCSNLVGLPDRVYSPSHKNAAQYDTLIDLLKGKQLIKLKGHSKKVNKTTDCDKIFAFVDKAARRALRQDADQMVCD